MMRRISFIVCAAALAASLWSGSASAVPAPVNASMRADVRAISPGEPFKVFIDFTIDPPWHIYWKMPGDAGLPTQVNFSMPVGYKVSALEWPPHGEFLQPGNLMGYGYEKHVTLTATVTSPRILNPGELQEIAADVKWLACAQICVPGSAELSVRLKVWDGPRGENRLKE